MIRRRHEEEHHGKASSERWLVSYADFVTLLFGFFVVMYSVSQVNEQKYRVLSDTLNAVFQGDTNRAPVDDENYPLDQRGAISGLSPEITLVDTAVLARELEDALVNFVRPGHVRISATEEWVQIDLNANLLFDTASAEPKPEAQEIFREIAAKLVPFDNEIEVSGHTDNVPIHTAKFHSNWELSSARASSVVRLLAGNGVKPSQLSAVGYGEHRPVADNETEQGRAANRRVVLMVARHAVERPTVPLPEAIPAVPAPATPDSPLMVPDKDAPPVDRDSSSPTAVPETENESPDDTGVQPVRLDNGGLLFRNDPPTR